MLHVQPYTPSRPFNGDAEARAEAARLIAERGFAVLWTPVVGRRTVTSIEEWDQLTAAKFRPRAPIA